MGTGFLPAGMQAKLVEEWLLLTILDREGDLYITEGCPARLVVLERMSWAIIG
jgi:hypothetical protein